MQNHGRATDEDIIKYYEYYDSGINGGSATCPSLPWLPLHRLAFLPFFAYAKVNGLKSNGGTKFAEERIVERVVGGGVGPSSIT